MSGPASPAGAPPISGSDHPEGCPLCGSTHREQDPVSREVHCAECGLVFDGVELVAPPPPLTSESGSEGSGRGIGPFVSPGSSRRLLGSVLTATRDGHGRPLGWQRRYEFQHLRRVMQRQTARAVDGPLERSQARGALQQCGQSLGVPPLVIAEAERIYGEAKQRGLFRGRSLPSSVGAAL
jgi:transcription initiation factor TFIIIB Brf1 subunit/transcription initiation factor TFIIB